MAGRPHLCSGPEEILFRIVEHLRSPDSGDLDLHRWPDGQAIRFANDQVLHLSQVNHLFRRLCLPLLYEHIIIRLTKAGLPTANRSTHALQFDLFRRTIERKPHLADLVRVIEIMEFPPNIKLDPDFLSVIDSHPSLLTVHWQSTTTGAFSFPNPSFLPHGALSRVRINKEELSGSSNSMELLWLYFAKLGPRVKGLTIEDTTSPFLSLTYPDLCEISTDVAPVFTSDSPGPLWWFPSFLERHPQLEVFSIKLGRCERRLAWEALKNIPINGKHHTKVETFV